MEISILLLDAQFLYPEVFGNVGLYSNPYVVDKCIGSSIASPADPEYIF